MQLPATALKDLKLRSFEVDERKVRVYGGDAAVVTARSVSVRKDGTRAVQRYTRTWIKQDGRWRVVANHGSMIEP